MSLFSKSPTPGDRIATAALDVLRGRVTGLPTEPGYCLAFVRLLVQRALGITYDQFYAHGVRVESTAKVRDWWARDMERGLRQKGWAVNTPREGPPNDPTRYAKLDPRRLRPGDLLFRHDTAKNKHGEHVGHVGIYLGGGLVIEQIDPNLRPYSARVARYHLASLTPLSEFTATTVIRWRS